jgi:hypothetical protein
MSRTGILSSDRPGDCPAGEDIGKRLLRLLVHNDLMEGYQEHMVFVTAEFKGG